MQHSEQPWGSPEGPTTPAGTSAGGRRSGMYARVPPIQGAPSKVAAVARQTQEQTLPRLRQMEGFKGFVALGDRQSGKVLGVSFWESEEALRATEQGGSGGRTRAAE